MNRARPLRTLMLVVALTIPTAAVTLGANPASAAPSAPAAPAHDSVSNGCTLSPDSSYVPVYYNFHSACDTHDYCYRYKWYGNSSAGRKACDDRFHSDMRNWCYNRYNAWYQVPTRYTCYGVAGTYYTAVRTFGGAFF